MIEVRAESRRLRRHLATRDEILLTAWQLARREGVGGLSMRELAARVGMRQPSLYTYFASKNAIYDAMFAQGWQTWTERLKSIDPPADARAGLRLIMAAFVAFGLEDPARFQLMCERPIPGFTPSPTAYAPAVEALRSFTAALTRYGIVASEAPDIATALSAGLVTQQIANEPGGDRWARLVDLGVEMFLGHFPATATEGTSS